MSTVAWMPAAMACAYWARPISPPSGHTAALLDMFCALNGATRTPRRASRRHSPATSVLLPTDEPVPSTISTGARGSGNADLGDGANEPFTFLGEPAGNSDACGQVE